MHRNRSPIAFWAGISSFFATVLAIGAINVFNPEDRIRFLGAIVVGVITAGGVYARERLSEERKHMFDKYGGTIVIRDVGDKRVFSLELDDDPEILEKKKEITFKVKLE